jgi:hypothetical protein
MFRDVAIFRNADSVKSFLRSPIKRMANFLSSQSGSTLMFDKHMFDSVQLLRSINKLGDALSYRICRVSSPPAT